MKNFYLFCFCWMILFFPLAPRAEIHLLHDIQTPALIAHASGALNGKIYLNSFEALVNAAANGFQLIELDLLETTDGRLIAAHDWKTFHQLTGKPEQTKPLSFNQARKRKILGTQHVLTDTDIFHFFNNRPDLYLVTDKIENLSLLKEKFGAFQDRIIVEVFTLLKYQEAVSLGFKNVAFCVWDNDSFYDLAHIYKIPLITMPSEAIPNRLDWLKAHPDITVLSFSTNDASTIQKYAPFISFWYTDDLTPPNPGFL